MREKKDLDLDLTAFLNRGLTEHKGFPYVSLRDSLKMNFAFLRVYTK